MKSCGSVGEGEKRERERRGSWTELLWNTLRKIQTPSMLSLSVRKEHEQACLPACRLTVTAICPWPVSLDYVPVCLSVSLSCRLSLCLSICHGVTVEVGGNSGAPGWRLECNRLHLLKRVRVAPPTASLLFPSCIWMTMTTDWLRTVATENGPNASHRVQLQTDTSIAVGYICLWLAVKSQMLEASHRASSLQILRTTYI